MSESYRKENTGPSSRVECNFDDTRYFLQVLEGLDYYKDKFQNKIFERVDELREQHKIFLNYSGLEVMGNSADDHYDMLLSNESGDMPEYNLDAEPVRLGIGDAEKFYQYLKHFPRSTPEERDCLKLLINRIAHEYRYHSFDIADRRKESDYSNTFYAMLDRGEDIVRECMDKLSLPGNFQNIDNNIDIYVLYAGTATTREGLVKDFFSLLNQLSQDDIQGAFADYTGYVYRYEEKMREALSLPFGEGAEDEAALSHDETVIERAERYERYAEKVKSILSFASKRVLMTHNSQHSVTPLLVHAGAVLQGMSIAFSQIIKYGSEGDVSFARSKLLEISELSELFAITIDQLCSKDILNPAERRKLSEVRKGLI